MIRITRTAAAIASAAALTACTGGTADVAAPERTATVAITSGSALPALEGAQDTPLTAAPTFTVTDIRGAEGELVTAGRPTIVVAVAHWCPACNAELPTLAGLTADEGPLSGVDIVVVLTGNDPTRPNHPADIWITEAGWDGRTAVDDADGTIHRTLGLTAYPGWVGVDRSGAVTNRVHGQLDLDAITQLASIVRG